MPAITDEFVHALDFTLKWEGGFVNDPHDPGGATMQGVTQNVYDGYRRRNGLPLQSVHQIDRKELIAIYQNNYWLAGDCDKLVEPLNLAHFDTSVNFGPFHAAKFLQQALGVTVDGVIGEETLKAAAAANAKASAIAICDERIAFRHARVKAKPDQERFLKGWLNRDNALKKLCST